MSHDPSRAATVQFADIPGVIGRSLVDSVAYLLQLTAFVLRALADWRRLRVGFVSRATLGPLYNQVIFTGVDALPMVSLLGLVIGFTVTTGLLRLAEAVGSQEQAALLLAEFVGLELSVVITAVVIIGRSGAAIVADLGGMKLRGEVEGLELLGININVFLVTPRLIGAVVAQLVLAVYFAATALFGGLIVGELLLAGDYWRYFRVFLEGIEPLPLVLFVCKNLFIGMLIAGTACFHALKVERSPTEVPQQVQAAIVNSLLMVFLLEGALLVAAR